MPKSSNWFAGAVLVLTLTGATARAATLVNKGGSSDVPTYEGRKYMIKSSGTGCNADVCFCNSGSLCTLPGTGNITGIVIIDRSGVTLDCQNRTIEAVRLQNTRQVCDADDDCGWRFTGAHTHHCVNNYCQLDNLAGINVGGPLYVDDSPINIDYNASGYVQDVRVVNCIVKGFDRGYNVDGFEGDNGLDFLDVVNSEFRVNNTGVSMSTTDSAYVNDIWSHDNSWFGVRAAYTWDLFLGWSTLSRNGVAVVLDRYDAPGNPNPAFKNRWVHLLGNELIAKDHGGDGLDIMALEGGAPNQCNSESAPCDLKVHYNHIQAPGTMPVLYLGPSNLTWLLRNNTIIGPNPEGIRAVEIGGPPYPTRVCWNKANTCYQGHVEGGYLVGTTQVPCRDGFTEPGVTCWY